ncbi:unnamed protein product [Chilo suppressalis]|uniref:Uncharacterized protein n=1 Tax=Chilo suppressalis TaxID=168631 RepID=A0ABN8B4W8_CHISP|nr:unnamed protein product [Chilo suppressalis]
MGAGGSKTIIAGGLKHCTLWKADRSPSCRAVMMALDALNLSITEVDVNMDKGEHKSPELTTLNPLQTLPIFKDRELILNDSHAISMYLANRYSTSDQLLPRDPGRMSVIAQLMHFDSGILYPRYQMAANPILYENCNFVMPQHVCDIECAYNDLETMLAGKTWLAGDTTTLADISVAATVSTLNVLVPIDHTRYPRLSSWLDQMSEEIYFITANKTGLGEFTRRIDRGTVCDDSVFKCPRSSTSRRGSVTERN